MSPANARSPHEDKEQRTSRERAEQETEANKDEISFKDAWSRDPIDPRKRSRKISSTHDESIEKSKNPSKNANLGKTQNPTQFAGDMKGD
jgi:hypothetical protein